VGIDTNGNVFVADNLGYIWKYAPAGTATAPTAGTTTQITANTPLGPYGLGIDSSNNVWFGTYASTAIASAGVGEVASGASTATYPSNSAYSTTATKGTFTLFVDAANGNKVYTGSQSAGVVYEYLTTAAPTATTSLGSAATNGLAVDASGNLWVVYTGSGSNGGSLSKYVPASVTPAYTCKVTVTTGAGMYNPRGIAIDGNGRIFVTSYTVPGIVEFDPSLGTACDVASDPGTFFTTSIGNGINPANSAGTGIVATSGARSETIDSSGALWAGNSVASTIPVVQILGIAAPVNPVLAAGKYGVKP
jgi:sugar lactone lactonase YvrE